MYAQRASDAATECSSNLAGPSDAVVGIHRDTAHATPKTPICGSWEGGHLKSLQWQLALVADHAKCMSKPF